MKVIVTGANGQLGYDIVNVFNQNGLNVYGFGKEQFDVTDLEQVREIVTRIKPDTIIHSAAFTAVDAAEADEDKTYSVNAFGTRNVTIAAQEVGAKICYISTDYVFDGFSRTPYKEYDTTNPIGVYGKSKLAGERFVQSLSNKFFVVRTSWVYGINGSNFVKSMLKLANEHQNLKVVSDQVGSPTYTIDLVKFIMELIITEKYGVYHASNTGFCSWYELATAIFEDAEMEVHVDPCSTEEFPRPAPRPRYSVMDHLSIRANGFQDLRHWRDALREFLCVFKNYSS